MTMHGTKNINSYYYYYYYYYFRIWVVIILLDRILLRFSTTVCSVRNFSDTCKLWNSYPSALRR